jgi:hypothetical protein
MKHKFILPAILTLSISLPSCGSSSSKKEPVTQDTTQKTKDTVTTTPVTDQDTTKPKEEKVDPALKSYLENAHNEFDKVPATFEAKYMGFDIGDYPHIIFKDKNGKEYDFGDGNNSYGTYKEEDFLADKSKYVGKKFKLTGEWKSSTFLCCDGNMDVHTGKVPSITNLELVK